MDEQMLLEALGLEKGGGYWQERLLAQLAYLDQAMTCRDVSRKDFEAELDRLAGGVEKTGALTKEMVLEAEARLGAVYGELVKSAQVIFAAHAHIDMNWEWGFDETVGVIIDTFQTMLDLMEEFPDFYFSQSQASTYAVIEQYCPSLLEPIRQRIAQGRWEVTASTWVEHDKNMAGTEAMLRQLICAKRYLSRLLGVDMDSLNLDFEPDTFGHSAYVPQVLRSAGVNYYYHCRGYDGKRAYRFRAPSGQEVLAYCEPNWYLGPVTYDMLSYVPAFCRQNGVDTAMVVYGVGDHGGGPTRRDIRRIRDMAAWPLLPRISMGRMGQFFQALEKARDRLPVVDRELNFVFTGCYTAQSRIKQANRYGEDRLHDSQALCAMAAQATGGLAANPVQPIPRHPARFLCAGKPGIRSGRGGGGLCAGPGQRQPGHAGHRAAGGYVTAGRAGRPRLHRPRGGGRVWRQQELPPRAPVLLQRIQRQRRQPGRRTGSPLHPV